MRATLRELIGQSGPVAAPAGGIGSAESAGLTKENLEALGRSLGSALVPVVRGSGKTASATAAAAMHKVTDELVNDRKTGLRRRLRTKFGWAPPGHQYGNLTLLNLMYDPLVGQGRWPTSAKVTIDLMAPLEDELGNSLSAGQIGLEFDKANCVVAGQRDPDAKAAADTAEYLAKFTMLCYSMVLVSVGIACSRTVGDKYYCHDGRTNWCSLTSAKLLVDASAGLAKHPLAVAKHLLADVLVECRNAVNAEDVEDCDLVSPSAAMRAQAKSLAKEVRRLALSKVSGATVAGPQDASSAPPVVPGSEAVSLESVRTAAREAGREAATLALREDLPSRREREPKSREERDSARKRNQERRNAKVTATDGKEYAAKQGGNKANPDWCPSPNCGEKSWCPRRHPWSA